ncbi:MAG: Xaa-Pro peptidase family protein [Actinobacteria bacterium]|nr:Xaa-Pro peptidase family protein [Actinomycetota bacterium]
MSYDFCEFKKEEFESRLNRLKDMMVREGLDAVILTEEENIRWVSGYWVFVVSQIKFMSHVVIVPSSDSEEPISLINHDSTGEGLSWIKKVRYFEKKTKPPYRTDEFTDVSGILAENLKGLKLDRSRIGMELGKGMRLNLEQVVIDDFRNSMPHAQFVDVSSSLWELRSIKSAAEIEKLKKASKITSDSITEGFKILRKGITERELGQFLVSYWFNNGATGISHVGVGFGDNAIRFAHCDPKGYPLKEGEVVKVDVGCSFEGYKCDMYRMACLGEPKKEEARVASVIKKANQAVISEIKENVKCSDLYKIAAKVFIDEDLEHLIPSTSIGHGIGLSVHEQPIVHKDNDDVLKAGMVLTVEPWTLNYDDWSMGMNIEDVVVVMKDGCEVLTDTDRDIFLI